MGVSGHAFVSRLKWSFARNRESAKCFSTHEGSASLEGSTVPKANAPTASIAAKRMMKLIVRLCGLSIICVRPPALRVVAARPDSFGSAPYMTFRRLLRIALCGYIQSSGVNSVWVWQSTDLSTSLRESVGELCEHGNFSVQNGRFVSRLRRLDEQYASAQFACGKVRSTSPSDGISRLIYGSQLFEESSSRSLVSPKRAKNSSR